MIYKLSKILIKKITKIKNNNSHQFKCYIVKIINLLLLKIKLNSKLLMVLRNKFMIKMKKKIDFSTKISNKNPMFLLILNLKDNNILIVICRYNKI